MRRTLRLPLALVTALVVAEAAVLLLRPRDPGVEPVPVDSRAYFSAGHLEKAEGFRAGQRWLFGAGLLVEGVVLAWLVIRPPAALDRLTRRPILGAAGAAAAVSVVLTVTALPVSAWSRERARDVGLITQGWGGWAVDRVKGEAIGATIAAAGGALLIVAMRRAGRRWWIPGAAVVLGFGVLTTYASPVVLDPLFNKFTPLPDGATRSAVLELAEEAGVDVGEVYEIDASRRTTASNAYVAGLGSTKRVVLYDNLLRDFEFDEIRLVVAHELAHVKHRDVPNGLLFLAIVAPFGMFAVARLAEALGAKPDARAIPATAAALAIVTTPVVIVSNQLSRAVERRADTEAMRLTGEPRTQIAFQRRIAEKNMSDPDPPRWVHALLGTHPTTLERIGAAEALLRD